MNTDSAIFAENIDIYILIRDTCISNTDMCISITDISNLRWNSDICFLKMQISVIEMQIYVITKLNTDMCISNTDIYICITITDICI